MDYSKTTLGEMLSSDNETIKRNAVAVLKVLQNSGEIFTDEMIECEQCGQKRVLTYKKNNDCTILMQEYCPNCGFYWSRNGK